MSRCGDGNPPRSAAPWSLPAAVPVDHGTCCACAGEIAALAADALIIAKTVVDSNPVPASSPPCLLFRSSTWTIINAAPTGPNAQGAMGRHVEPISINWNHA